MNMLLRAPDEAAVAHPSSVADQMAAARHAQAAWAAAPLKQRVAAIRRLRHRIATQAVQLAEAARTGRSVSRAEVLASEVLPLADACRFLERQAPALLRSRRLAGAKPAWLVGVRTEVRREPFGVVLVIGPSNYPLFLPAVQALQALAAGNAVLLKPGTGGGAAAEAFARLCTKVGLSPGLLQILPESPEAATEAIAAGVDKVVLTGSADTGRRVLAQLAPRLVPATMELSGCDAAFVRADADLALVARALRFGLVWNNGATCIAPRRVFVARERAAELERQLIAALREVPERSGRWALPPTAAELVREAVAQGARPLFGPDGPAVLTDARPEMRLLQHEVFAPVLAIVVVADDDAALTAAAACPYALGATVFGKEAAARRFAERVNAGVVVVNDVIVPTADPRLPFGGRGRSGFGVTRGAEGLLEMTRVKAVAVRGGRARHHLDEPDFTDQDLVQKYLLAAHGPGWLGRLAAAAALAVQLVRKARKAPKEHDR